MIYQVNFFTRHLFLIFVKCFLVLISTNIIDLIVEKLFKNKNRENTFIIVTKLLISRSNCVKSGMYLLHEH